MPARKTAAPKPETSTPDLDNLLSADASAPSAPKVDDEPKRETVKPEENGEPQEDQPDTEQSELQAEIARLKAELEQEKAKKFAPVTESGRPAADYELTPEQLELRNIRDALAKEKAANLDRAVPQYQETGEAAGTIHFVESGFTAFNNVWGIGQTVVYSAADYEETKDRNGNSWLDLTEAQQARRFGRVYFRKGPSPYAVDPEIAAEEAERAGRVPVIDL